jgi:CheY-like chemotaxis protein
MKILYVEDDVATLEAMKTLLESYGAIVKTALSAKQALDAFEQFDADLVISDIAMPEIDGYSLLKSIRSQPLQKSKPTPVIALTAFAEPEEKKRADEAGFQDYLVKPIAVNVLLKTIGRFKKNHE